MASILFLGSQLLSGIIKHDVGWMPALQLAKKNYHANYKLDHNANAERAERVKKRYELARGRTCTRERTEAAENVESLWKTVFLFLGSPSVSQFDRRRGKSKRRE